MPFRLPAHAGDRAWDPVVGRQKSYQLRMRQPRIEFIKRQKIYQ